MHLQQVCKYACCLKDLKCICDVSLAGFARPVAGAWLKQSFAGVAMHECASQLGRCNQGNGTMRGFKIYMPLVVAPSEW